MSNQNRIAWRGMPTSQLSDPDKLQYFAEAVRENVERLQALSDKVEKQFLTYTDLFNAGILTPEQSAAFQEDKEDLADLLSQKGRLQLPGKGKKNRPFLTFADRTALVAYIDRYPPNVNNALYQTPDALYKVSLGSTLIPDLPDLIPAREISYGHFNDAGGAGTVTLNVPAQFAQISDVFDFLDGYTIPTNTVLQIKVADGTYNVAGNCNHQSGAQIEIIGNETTHANVILLAGVEASTNGFTVTDNHTIRKINGFTIRKDVKAYRTGSGTGISTSEGGTIAELGPAITVENWWFGVTARRFGFINIVADSAATSNLDSGITVGATSFDVDDGSVYPATPFYAEIQGTSDPYEIIEVTNVSSNTLTVSRAQQGTTAVAWSANTPVVAPPYWTGGRVYVEHAGDVAYVASAGGELFGSYAEAHDIDGQFSSAVSSTLSSGITDSATSFDVADGSVYPNTPFYAEIDDGGTPEIIEVTNIATNTLTVRRGLEGSTAQAWVATDTVTAPGGGINGHGAGFNAENGGIIRITGARATYCEMAGFIADGGGEQRIASGRADNCGLTTNLTSREQGSFVTRVGGHIDGSNWMSTNVPATTDSEGKRYAYDGFNRRGGHLSKTAFNFPESPQFNTFVRSGYNPRTYGLGAGSHDSYDDSLRDQAFVNNSDSDVDYTGWYASLNDDAVIADPKTPTGFLASMMMVVDEYASGGNGSRAFQMAFEHTDINAYIRKRLKASNNWDDWTRLYHWENILEDVSETAGVPTGGIIERGTGTGAGAGDGDGNYVKFADGTMICTEYGFTLTRQHDDYVEVTWTFPRTFASSIEIVINMSRTRNATDYTTLARTDIGAHYVHSLSTTSATIGYMRCAGATAWSAGTEQIVNVKASAIGRWF